MHIIEPPLRQLEDASLYKVNLWGRRYGNGANWCALKVADGRSSCSALKRERISRTRIRHTFGFRLLYSLTTTMHQTFLNHNLMCVHRVCARMQYCSIIIDVGFLSLAAIDLLCGTARHGRKYMKTLYQRAT